MTMITRSRDKIV